MEPPRYAPGFRLFPAFSIETLAAKLTQELALRRDPFVPETILITNYAQRIWLQHFIAERNGICANIRFLSPETFLNVAASEPANPTTPVFDRDALTWRVFKALCALHAPDSGTPEALRFPFREEREEDFILLARALADLFWRYQSFRPEMIAAWMRGEDPDKLPAGADFRREYTRQKHLWQSLALPDEAVPALRYLRMLDKTAELETENLPPRLFVFAPTAIPRVHFEMLQKLSKHTQVLFFYHNLSSDLWTETVNEKTRFRENCKRPQLAGESAWIESVPGNELLTSWGKAARMLAMRLIDDGHIYHESSNGDAPPERDSLLHCIQADIRENRETPAPDEERVPEAMKNDLENAVSLRVHSAHSPMREMEILRDDLRDLFTRDPAMRPRDVLVMLPDVDAYAPFIHAVFDNCELPFSLADSAGSERFSGISALLALLKIAQGEFRLSEILALLDALPIRRRLRLDEKQTEQLRKILINAEAHWGLNTRSRETTLASGSLAFPNDAQSQRVFYNNSWAFATRRCALGVMLGNDFSNSEEAFPLQFGNAPEIAPLPNLPDNAAELLGKFARILHAAETLYTHFSGEKKSIDAWCRLLKTELIEALLEFSDEESEEAELLENTIETIRRSGEIAGMDESDTCSLKTLVSLLENRSWQSEHGTGMLRGKITFCQLQPLRNIPAKAIYIAGMNNGDFPNPTRRSAFDLIAQWRNGNATDSTYWDRSTRDEDCLLLLEAVLAAKTYLRFSYIGRRATDNSVIPPCTPLAKFIDYAERIAPKNTFFFSHSAQPPEHALAVKNKSVRAPQDALPSAADACFMQNAPVPLNERERERFSELSLKQLCAFFAEPAKFICENRLALSSRWHEDKISDDDPESETVKTKTLISSIVENFSASPLNSLTEENFDREIRERLIRAIDCARAKGSISALAVSDKVAREFKFRTTLPLGFVAAVTDSPSRDFTPVPETEIPHNFNIEYPRKKAPETVRVNGSVQKICRLGDADGTSEKLVFLEAAPSIYSSDWELKIHACVTAAFLRDAFPQHNFTLAVFPSEVLEDGKFCVVQSNRIPENLSKHLLNQFFDGLEKPPLFFSKMKLPKEHTPETFAEAFIKDEYGNSRSVDFNRPFRTSVFGTDFEPYRAEIASEPYRFFLTIDAIAQIPELPRSRLRSKRSRTPR